MNNEIELNNKFFIYILIYFFWIHFENIKLFFFLFFLMTRLELSNIHKYYFKIKI